MNNIRLLNTVLVQPAQMASLSDEKLCSIAKAAYESQMECELKRAVAESTGRVQSVVWLALAMQAGRASAKAA